MGVPFCTRWLASVSVLTPVCRVGVFANPGLVLLPAGAGCLGLRTDGPAGCPRAGVSASFSLPALQRDEVELLPACCSCAHVFASVECQPRPHTHSPAAEAPISGTLVALCRLTA